MGATALSLAGCAGGLDSYFQTSDEKGTTPVTEAPLPSVVKPYPRIEQTLACIRDTGALHNYTFVVGPFADSTGKINAVAPGSTGNYIPQGGSASYITDAIVKSGGRVVSTYFGAPPLGPPAQYVINGIFNSLDFGETAAMDARVSGLGPTGRVGWAQLSLTIQLDAAGTRLNRQMSMIQRPVRYTSLGLGSGRIYDSTLVTGNVMIQNQERLQFEAINGPIALGVADTLMKEFPTTRGCKRYVADLLESAAKTYEGPVPVDPATPAAPVRRAPAPTPTPIRNPVPENEFFLDKVFGQQS